MRTPAACLQLVCHAWRRHLVPEPRAPTYFSIFWPNAISPIIRAGDRSDLAFTILVAAVSGFWGLCDAPSARLGPLASRSESRSTYTDKRGCLWRPSRGFGDSAGPHGFNLFGDGCVIWWNPRIGGGSRDPRPVRLVSLYCSIPTDDGVASISQRQPTLEKSISRRGGVVGESGC